MISFRLLKFKSTPPPPQSWLSKSIRIVLKCYLNPVSIILKRIRKTASLEIKMYWIQFQLINLIKTEDFDHFLLKFLPPQKVVPIKSFFFLNMSFVFRCMLFCLHCIIQVCFYAATEIDIFDINWSARNSLKRWRVTYLDKSL